jgi:hypothetical protein
LPLELALGPRSAHFRSQILLVVFPRDAQAVALGIHRSIAVVVRHRSTVAPGILRMELALGPRVVLKSVMLGILYLTYVVGEERAVIVGMIRLEILRSCSLLEIHQMSIRLLDRRIQHSLENSALSCLVNN